MPYKGKKLIPYFLLPAHVRYTHAHIHTTSSPNFILPYPQSSQQSD
jgi:hypothetical protein